MKIETIVDIDEFAAEAEIIITDGNIRLHCCCFYDSYPYVGMEINTPLSILSAYDIITIENGAPCAKKIPEEGFYAYAIKGILVSGDIGLIKVGDILMETSSYIPKDIKDGQTIAFKVDRLDAIV